MDLAKRAEIEANTTHTKPHERSFMPPFCSARVFEDSGESLDVMVDLTPLNNLLTVTHRSGVDVVRLVTGFTKGEIKDGKVQALNKQGEVTSEIGFRDKDGLRIYRVEGSPELEQFMGKPLDAGKLFIGLTNPGLITQSDPFRHVILGAIAKV